MSALPRPPRVTQATAPQPAYGGVRLLAAWAVHLYTACGAPIAYLALRAIDEQRFPDAFRWLALAMAIDCSDGALARAVDVKRVLPWFDGTRLDDIVDYLAYVLVPVVLLYEAGRFPEHGATWCAAAPLLASAYGFCRADAKTADHYFRGFPSYWNVVALYAYVLPLSPRATMVWILALSALVFAPLKFLYPSRAPHFRGLTIGLGLVWAVIMIAIVLTLPATPPALVWASLAFPVYYAAMSAWLQATGR